MEKLLDTGNQLTQSKLKSMSNIRLGKVKSIGVSNFSIKNLDILLTHAQVVPATNQVEIHPLYPQFELQNYCKEKGILLTAYSPLGIPSPFVTSAHQVTHIRYIPIGQGRPEFFEDTDYTKIVEAHKVDPAQIAISWLVQRGIIAIPKSANVSRMKTNISVSLLFLLLLLLLLNRFGYFGSLTLIFVTSWLTSHPRKWI